MVFLLLLRGKKGGEIECRMLQRALSVFTIEPCLQVQNGYKFFYILFYESKMVIIDYWKESTQSLRTRLHRYIFVSYIHFEVNLI